jgi:hypothetical protein
MSEHCLYPLNSLSKIRKYPTTQLNECISLNQPMCNNPNFTYMIFHFQITLSLKVQGSYTHTFLSKFQKNFLYMFQYQVIDSINFHNVQINSHIFLSSGIFIFIYYHQHKNNFFFFLYISSNISTIILFKKNISRNGTINLIRHKSKHIFILMQI